MLRFSMNTIGLFPGKPFDAAFSVLKSHGYDTFEIWSLDNIDLPRLKADMDAYGMKLSTCCPSFFILNDETRRAEYEASLRKAIDNCHFLNCPSLITQVGQDTGAPRAQQHKAILDGLKAMAPILEDNGITLLVEPLNSVKDHVGYYLTDSNEGFALIEEVNSPNVRLLYDVYHQVHMGENVLERIQEHLPLIAHYHIAGHPNRDEKLIDNFDYTAVFELLTRNHVTSPVGVELFPKTDAATEQLLTELKKWAH